MSPESVMNIGRQAIEVTLMLSGPLLLSALVIGLIISIFQAATQINEATLSFIPKLIGTFLVLVLAGPWMLQVMVEFMRQLFESIPQFIG
ncbi:flagellar biosynthesis protein FliQ [Propionivibrio limicola]|uniref:flagellar biosynthesis protein FliQ n=1 Tax=Propionivibrio limicola TaxID=167645 RepID=UPI001292BC38|nr:flagellar biosynthesis protein FliQ [Propionivibrio limicola]